jgi:four helix bundle protein
MLDAGCAPADNPASQESIMSYRTLDIWKLARQATIEIHQMTLTRLPNFEMFEVGSQIRRSVKSIRSNIVEGYGRRRYRQEFVKHLVYAQGSCDETMNHLETLFETGSLKDEELFNKLRALMDELGRKLNLFTQSVEVSHRSEK